MLYSLSEMTPSLLDIAGGGILYGILSDLDYLDEVCSRKSSSTFPVYTRLGLRQMAVMAFCKMHKGKPKLRGCNKLVLKRLSAKERVSYAESIGVGVEQIVYASDYDEPSTSVYLITPVEGFVRPGGKRLSDALPLAGTTHLSNVTYYAYKIK
ncbi:MAG: hypothetical protein D8H91_05070 [Alloprevotella sp.]|nr:MAG: hypothetical protein D8H91_05070 [Alloprevotella sp.]